MGLRSASFLWQRAEAPPGGLPELFWRPSGTLRERFLRLSAGILVDFSRTNVLQNLAQNLSRVFVLERNWNISGRIFKNPPGSIVKNSGWKTMPTTSCGKSAFELFFRKHFLEFLLEKLALHELRQKRGLTNFWGRLLRFSVYRFSIFLEA